MSQTYHLKQNKTKLMLGLIYSLQNVFTCILSIIDKIFLKINIFILPWCLSFYSKAYLFHQFLEEDVKYN